MLIFDIKRYAINDGPGIRTTIFFKGCPLRCVWCHNPESWSARTQRLYKKSKCIGCLSCIEACPQGAIRMSSDGIVPVEDVQCIGCGHCAEACPTTALEMCGRAWDMEELMVEIEKERDIMADSGGGVTLCGGEPLMQADACLETLHELGCRGFHRAVDTTLCADPQLVEQVADECELFLIDIKLMDGTQHRRFTGVDNRLILDNIRLLARRGKRMWIRIPLIEGVNTDEANIEATARFLVSLREMNPDHNPVEQVNLLPYHDIGKDKHRRLWSHYNPQNLPMATPTDATADHCSQLFAAHGIRAIQGG